MMKLYQIDMMVVATAYIRAASQAEAMVKALSLKDEGLIVSGDELISGRRFDDAALPSLSLSPAMTILGPMPGYRPQEAE